MTGHEREALETEGIETLVLRYGQFYGPGTYYARDGISGARSRSGACRSSAPAQGSSPSWTSRTPPRRRSPPSTRRRPASTTSATTSPRRCRSGCRSTPRRWARSLHGGCRLWLARAGRRPARSPTRRSSCAAPPTPRPSASWAGSRATRAGARASARRSASGRRPRIRPVSDLEAAKQTLLEELREHSLVIGEVTLSSGAMAQYYVDARRALLRPAGLPRRRRADRGRCGRGRRDRCRRPGDGGDPARLRGDRGARRRRPGRLLRPQANARSTACSAGSRARSRPAPAASSSRTRSPPAARPSERSSGSASRASRSPPCSSSSTASPAAASGSKRRRKHPTGRWSRSTRSTRSAPTGARRWSGRARPEPGDPEGGPSAVEIRVVGCLIEKQRTTPDVYPALAQLAADRLQPVDQSRPGRRLRRGDRERGAAAAGAARLDPAGERPRRTRPQVPPPARRGARARRRRDLAARGADAARSADPGRAEAAQRAPASFADLAAVHETLDGLVGRGRSPVTRGGRARRRSATSSSSAPLRSSNRRRASLSPATPRSGWSGSSASSRSCANRSRRCAPPLASSGRRRVAPRN